MTPGKAEVAEATDLHGFFKLKTSFSYNNLYLFDGIGDLHKYADDVEILKEFFRIRFHIHEKRLEYIKGELQAEIQDLENKVNFCEVFHTLKAHEKEKKEVVAELRQLNFVPDPTKAFQAQRKAQRKRDEVAAPAAPKAPDDNDQIEELNKLLEKLRDHVQKLETLLLMLNSDAVEIHQIKDIKDDLEYYIENCRDPDFMENDMLYEDIDGLEEMLLDEGNDSDFDYLFKIISFSIFKDKVAALRKKMAEKKKKLKIMEDKSPADIYNEDLDEFLAKLESEPSDTVPFYVHDDDSAMCTYF